MKKNEPEDPLELVGVQMRDGPDDKALEEIAWCMRAEITDREVASA